MKADDLFHLGVVAADPAAARSDFTSLLGYTWGPEITSRVEATTPGGDLAPELACAFTIGSPRIEVVTEVPGTLWCGGGIHHLGYWSDDVESDLERAESVGFVREAVRLGPDGKLFFAFCRNRAGLRIEIVTRAAEGALSQCWASADVDI